MAVTWKAAAVAMLLVAVQQVPAQPSQTPYRCVSRGHVTYSGVPCPGGREVGVKPVRNTDKWKAPPQDRATVARRASLSPEERQECRALDAKRSEQEAQLKAKGEGVTLADEMPLVATKRRARELRC